jgi:hypothetical protein
MARQACCSVLGRLLRRGLDRCCPSSASSSAGMPSAAAHLPLHLLQEQNVDLAESRAIAPLTCGLGPAFCVPSAAPLGVVYSAGPWCALFQRRVWLCFIFTRRVGLGEWAPAVLGAVLCCGRSRLAAAFLHRAAAAGAGGSAAALPVWHVSCMCRAAGPSNGYVGPKELIFGWHWGFEFDAYAQWSFRPCWVHRFSQPREIMGSGEPGAQAVRSQSPLPSSARQ